MSNTATRLHSVVFGEKNTWDDWHLIPVKRPVVAFPEPKTISIDIPAGNGEIDLSEAITKFPVYSNRKGEFSFRFVDNPNYDKVLIRRNEIASYLHGKKLDMYLTEEPEYYYSGRFALQDMTYAGNGDYADVIITYNLEPFKLSAVSTTGDWLWDIFNFETGTIMNEIFANITVDSDSWSYINDFQDTIGDKAIVPNVIVTGGAVYVKRYDSKTQSWGTEFLFPVGETYNPSFVINANHTSLAIKGHGTVSFDFRIGRL